MPFYVYDGHLSEFGNQVVADAVWKWLFTTTPSPVVAVRRPDMKSVSSAIPSSR
jgi:hypothetical protein